MAIFKMKIKGQRKLTQKLKRIPKRDADKAIRKGTRQGAKMVTAEAKRLAPKLTGKLKRNLKTRAMKRSRKRIGHRTTILANSFVGAFYASFVELGTKKIRARKFLEQAARVKGKSAGEAATKTIKREIESKART